MFRCENKGCGKAVPPRTPINFVTTEEREQTYENPVYRKGKTTKRNQFTRGTEIVKQIKVCPKCFERITGEKAQVARPASRSTASERSSFQDRRPHKKPWKNPKNKDTKQENEASKQKKSVVVEKINPIKK